MTATPSRHFRQVPNPAQAKTYSLNNLRNAASSLGIGSADILCVHSALWRLGLLEQVPVGLIPAAVAECLLDIVGSHGTLAVPAFNFGFCRGETFVREETPAVNMGALSEFIRTRSGSHRSGHPMQSIAALGAAAEEICSPDSSTAFDPGGSFDLLVQSGAKLLLLGADFNAASIIHSAEQRVGVPYRYFKKFTGPYQEGGVTSERTYAMYVRDLELNPLLCLHSVALELAARKQLQECRLGRGMLMVARLDHVRDAAESLLLQDPWCFVLNRSAGQAPPTGSTKSD